MSDENRQTARRKMFLAENEAHIWQISLKQNDEALQISARLLDETEQSKTAKFRFGKDRKNYIAAHGAMREILSLYLEICPQNIEFETNSYGKPFLCGGKSDISFNLSHSGELALLAITKGSKIGVDIELIRADIAAENLAEQVFSTLEIETWRNLPENFKAKAFFDCWTRKEAFIKAVGKGLSYPLKDFSVAFSPCEQARLIALENTKLKAENWQIIELNIAENYAAAMAIEARNTKLFLWNFSNNF